jgi:hypothetical protein
MEGSSFNLRSEDEIEIQSTQGLCQVGSQTHQKSDILLDPNFVRDQESNITIATEH